MKLVLYMMCFTALAGAAEEFEFKAKEQENQVVIKTPWGEKTFVGDYGIGGYRLEIPIEDLEPEYVKKRRLAGKGDGTNGENNNNTNNNNTNSSNSTNSTVESSSKERETVIKETKIIQNNDDDFIGPRKLPPKITVEYDDSDRLVLEANRLFNRKKFDEALSAIDELLRRKPNYIRGWIMKGSVMYVRGHKDLAKTAWNQALAIEPENSDVKSILEKYK